MKVPFLDLVCVITTQKRRQKKGSMEMPWRH